MTGTLNVQIIRPKRTGREVFITIVGNLFGYLVNGYAVMLVFGTISSWDPSYWHSTLLVIGVRALIMNTDYLTWTKAAK